MTFSKFNNELKMFSAKRSLGLCHTVPGPSRFSWLFSLSLLLKKDLRDKGKFSPFPGPFQDLNFVMPPINSFQIAT